MRKVKLKNSGFGLRRVVEVNDGYTWSFKNLVTFGGIISFRIIKINKT